MMIQETQICNWAEWFRYGVFLGIVLGAAAVVTFIEVFYYLLPKYKKTEKPKEG
jgi:hypothetical protein